MILTGPALIAPSCATVVDALHRAAQSAFGLVFVDVHEHEVALTVLNLSVGICGFDDQPVHPRFGHQQVRSAADHAHRHTVVARPAQPAGELLSGSGEDEPIGDPAHPQRRIGRQAHVPLGRHTPLPRATSRRSDSSVTSPAPMVKTMSPGLASASTFCSAAANDSTARAS